MIRGKLILRLIIIFIVLSVFGNTSYAQDWCRSSIEYRMDDDGSNILDGTNRNDFLRGLSGNDKIRGLRGDDCINGNSGADTVNGNEGNDYIRGGKDNDIVRGGRNNDHLYGDLGEDHLYGDCEDDILEGGDGKDRYYYRRGDGHDIIHDSGENIIIFEDILESETRFISEGQSCRIYFFTGNQKVGSIEVTTCANTSIQYSQNFDYISERNVTINQGSTVRLDATINGARSTSNTFRWLTNGISVGPSHHWIEVAPAGNTEYQLEVKNQFGCVYTDIYSVTVIPAPRPPTIIADFSTDPDPAQGGAPLTVTFINQSTAQNTTISSYEWDFNNDGVIDSTAANPLYIYTTPGIFTVSLRVSSDTTSNQITQTVTVQDITAPDTGIDTATDGDGQVLANNDSTLSNEIRLSFSGSDLVGVAGFECSLDGAAFGDCVSPLTLTNLSLGTHNFQVRAVDAAGNSDATPSEFNWTVQSLADAVQDVIGNIQDILNTNLPNKVKNRLDTAIAKLQEAVDALTLPDLQNATTKLEQAAKQINDAIRNGLDSQIADDLTEQLIIIARQIALDAIDQAILTNGNQTKIANAQAFFAEAESLRASGELEDALSKYQDAVQEALKA